MIRSAHGTLRAGGWALTAAATLVAAAWSPGPASAQTTATSSTRASRPGAAVPAATKHATAIRVVPPNLTLAPERVGSFFVSGTSRIVNVSKKPVRLYNIAIRSGDRSDFVIATDCFPKGHPRTLAPHRSCRIKVVFTPHKYGTRTVILRITDSTLGSPRRFRIRGAGTVGYYLSGSPGGVASFGDAVFKGQPKPKPLSAKVISMTATRTGDGYWILGADGGVFAFGDAKFYGSTGARRLAHPVVGMAATRSGKGYWLVAGDGGIFAFGDAKYYGSTGAIHLNQRIVGMAATRTGKGYWLVARDGGIFAFGDAKFYGSTGGIRLARPIVGMVRSPSGNGYFLVARDGGIFTFGDARFAGSGGGAAFGNVVGMALTPDGGGYWVSNSVGQVFVFGNAPYFGDLYRRRTTNATGAAATAPTIGPTKPRTVIDEPSPKALNALMDPLANHRVSVGSMESP